MRDQVFHLGKSRSLHLEDMDELYWLVVDVMRARGYGSLVKVGDAPTARLVSANNRERVWVLESDEDRPRARWAVNATGRGELHDLYPKRAGARRRRRYVRTTGSDCTPPRRSVPGFQRLSDDD